MATMAAPAAVGVKMLKHVAKYPHDNINGLLIGKQSAEGVTIVDAVPLFSGYLELSPMLEVAMEQVTAWAKKNGNVVVGYYECRMSKAPSPQSIQGSVCKAVGTWIASVSDGKVPVAVAFIDSAKWKAKTAEAFTAFTVSGDDSPVSTRVVFEGSVERPQALQDSFRTFEEFLDDASADWSNPN